MENIEIMRERKKSVRLKNDAEMLAEEHGEDRCRKRCNNDIDIQKDIENHTLGRRRKDGTRVGRALEEGWSDSETDEELELAREERFQAENNQNFQNCFHLKTSGPKPFRPKTSTTFVFAETFSAEINPAGKLLAA